MFRSIVPFLILLSCLLLAVQDPLRRWVDAASRRRDRAGRARARRARSSPAIYGGYFGAGLGIMLIAVLGLFSAVPFTQLNAVKQPLAAAINLSAAAFLVFSGKIEWTLVAVMAPGQPARRCVRRAAVDVPPGQPLQVGVITFGVVISVIYLVR